MTIGVRTIDELDAVVDAYLQFDEFVFDIETKGPHPLDPQRNEVFWISLAGPGRCDVIPCGHPVGERVVYAEDDETHRIHPTTKKYQERIVNPVTDRLKWFDLPPQFTPAPKQLWTSDVFEALRPLFFSDRRKVNHNVKFDLCSIAKYYDGAIPPPPYGCTLVAARLVDETFTGYRLGQCIERAFHFTYQKLGRLGVENFPYSEAYEYSFNDAKYTWLLWSQKLERGLDREKVRHIFDLEMDLMPGIMDMEMQGIRIDRPRLQALDERYSLDMEKLQLAIDEDNGGPINLNATLQVAEFIYDKLGYECIHFTKKTGARQVNKEALELRRKDRRVKRILDFKQLHKIRNTFIRALQERTVNGRVHPTFNQVGARTGRVSCSEPNLQQIPIRSERGKRMRELFIPSKNKVLVVADLSQIELRMLAHFTQDPVLVDAYQRNLDLHGLLAERVFGPDYTELQRMLAKNGNFSILYGAMPRTLVARYNFPNLRTAERVLDAFYDTYTRVQPWKRRVLSECKERWIPQKQQPYVTTILGRKCRIPALVWPVPSQRQAAERQAISVRIQGSAADLFKLAMIQCYTQLGRQDWEGHMLMTVHDEIIVEVPRQHAEEGLAIVTTSLEDITNPFTNKPILKRVPIVADAKIVDRWSQK